MEKTKKRVKERRREGTRELGGISKHRKREKKNKESRERDR